MIFKLHGLKMTKQKKLLLFVSMLRFKDWTSKTTSQHPSHLATLISRQANFWFLIRHKTYESGQGLLNFQSV
jgi:hypothetical protein